MSWFKNKIKMVAARASDALAQAADIVAPTLYESRLEEFHHRWMTIERFLESVLEKDLDPVEQRRLLLESATRDALQKLVLLIYAEENATDRDELTRDAAGFTDWQSPTPQQLSAQSPQQQWQQQPSRACLEYLLERQLIPRLCEVGRRDHPCGIMSLSMQFVAALLSRVNHPILPTREVHVSVVALIQAATKREVDDPIVRKCLITLLNVLWKKLRGDPVQTEFFFLHAVGGQGNVSDLVLFTALLPHMYSNGKVGEKCREALVIAAAMHETALCRFVLRLTPFCHYAVNGVISAFDALPKTLPDTTGNTAIATSSGDIEGELLVLATRLRFCCTLAMVGRFEVMNPDEHASAPGEPTSITSELLSQFRTRFLHGPLRDGLTDTSEAVSRTFTLYARIILEDLVSCCREPGASPLLAIYVRFLMPRTSEPSRLRESGAQQIAPEVSMATDVKEASPPVSTGSTGSRDVPVELMHHMDSLSSSLSVATMDLFTCLLELQDEDVDTCLLGGGGNVVGTRGRTGTRDSSLSPRPHQQNGAIWLASRFPDSAVAANAHVWKIQAFDVAESSDVEIPASASIETDSSEHQIVSLLSYIADAEYVTCQRAPAVLDDWESSEDEVGDADEDESTGVDDAAGQVEGEMGPCGEQKRGKRESTTSPSASARTAATRNATKPLKEATLTISLPSYSPVVTRDCGSTISTASIRTSFDGDEELPVFFRVVLNRVERVLESSFHENLALSGLISVLAQKTRCADLVFDATEQRGPGMSVRAVMEEVHGDAVRRIDRLANGTQRVTEIRRRLIEQNNEPSLNDHEGETRLLCGFVVLEEILKELCSILFARERVKCLPVRPEGYYLEAKRSSTSSMPRGSTGEKLLCDTDLEAPARGSLGEDNEKPPLSIGQEFEQLIADAESTMGSLLSIGTEKDETDA